MSKLIGRIMLVALFLFSVLVVGLAGNQQLLAPTPTPTLAPAPTPAVGTAPVHAVVAATAPVPTLQPSTPPVVALHVTDRPQGVAVGYVRGEEMVWVASLGS